MSDNVPKEINTDNIKPIGNLIAYDIALGLSYDDIAVHHNLSIDQVHKIARGNLVKKKVKEFQLQLEERILAEQAEDPVRKFLHGKGMVFANAIVDEATAEDSEEGSSTAATRLKAAEMGLKYGGRQVSQEQKAPQMIINITQDKVDKAKSIQAEVLENVPDYVDG